MSQRVVEELKTTLTQSFTFNNDIFYAIEAVRPFIFFFNTPAGTFTLTIKQGAETMATGTFTSAAIQTALGTSDNYFYAWIKILTTTTAGGLPNLKKGAYDFILSSSGYTHSASSFIGWIQEHENLHNSLLYTSAGIRENPFAVQIFTKRNSEQMP